MILLTFLGMVGLYIGLLYAYQLYQQKRAELETGSLGSVLRLFSGS
jgi:hypothetical protein